MTYLEPPFLAQAKRVLKPGGLFLAKISDLGNGHRAKWSHCDFMGKANEAGFAVCDLIVNVRAGAMVSTKWVTAHHVSSATMWF